MSFINTKPIRNFWPKILFGSSFAIIVGLSARGDDKKIDAAPNSSPRSKEIYINKANITEEPRLIPVSYKEELSFGEAVGQMRFEL